MLLNLTARRTTGRILLTASAAILIACLLSSVGHNHIRPSQGCPEAACIHCGGGAIAQPPSLPEPLCAAFEPIADESVPVPPAIRSLLRLDHSGCAPPRSAPSITAS